MKSIMYVSRIVDEDNGGTIASGLSSIYDVAQKENNKHSVTGVFCCRSGHYIQVIEGDESDVDQLFNNITLDNRHHEVTTLFDMPITERSFSSWDMKLVESVSKDSRFQAYMTKHADLISTVSDKNLALLERFYDISKI